MQVEHDDDRGRRHRLAHDLRRGGARQRLGADPIDPAVAAKGASPRRSVAGGPNGVYSGCDVGTPVLHYGHGYGVAVAQGKLEGGVSTNWHDDGFGWAGFGAPGDSGFRGDRPPPGRPWATSRT